MSGGRAETEIGNQRCVLDLYHVHPEEEKPPPSTGVHLSSSNTKKVTFLTRKLCKLIILPQKLERNMLMYVCRFHLQYWSHLSDGKST